MSVPMDTSPQQSGGYSGSSMEKLGTRFDKLATGTIQRPRRPVTSVFEQDQVGSARAAYQRHLSQDAGPLFMHFMASIPCIQEELARIGCALAAWSQDHWTKTGRPLTYFEMDAFDGTQARTLARKMGTTGRTLTCSPNPANQPWFERSADRALSSYLPYSLFDLKSPLSEFPGGFDVLYEMAAFQFYGPDRRSQIAHAASYLAPGGVAIFLEKMNQDDPEDYRRREIAKDEIFKTRYFTTEEIEWKTRNFLLDMVQGQVTLTEFLHAASGQFAHLRVLWHSTNFYEIAASNDEQALEVFCDRLGPRAIEPDFVFDRENGH